MKFNDYAQTTKLLQICTLLQTALLLLLFFLTALQTATGVCVGALGRSKKRDSDVGLKCWEERM